MDIPAYTEAMRKPMPRSLLLIAFAMAAPAMPAATFGFAIDKIASDQPGVAKMAVCPPGTPRSTR